jgi:hypothetical protein
VKRLGQLLAIFILGGAAAALLWSTGRHQPEDAWQDTAGERSAFDAGNTGTRPALVPADSTNAVSSHELPVAHETSVEETAAVHGELGLDEIARLPPEAQERIADFSAEPRDPLWAAVAEGELLGALSQSNVALIDWHVECRSSVCAVRYVSPDPADPQVVRRDLRTLFEGLTQGSNLIGAPMIISTTADGTVAGWMHLHRRCGPDWNCLEKGSSRD